MLWARIDFGRVEELTDIDPEGRFPPGAYNWQPCPENTQQNWIAEQEEGGGWIFYPYVAPPVPIPVVAEAKRVEVRSACSEEITRSSFQSSALGAVHNYDCRLVDQINLKMRFDIAEASGSVEPLWASDGTRYQWKDHTAEEIMDVMVDMNDHIKTAQVKLATLMASVDAATTKAQIDAITW